MSRSDSEISSTSEVERYEAKVYSKNVMSRVKGWVVEAKMKGKATIDKALKDIGIHKTDDNSIDAQDLQDQLDQKKEIRKRQTIKWEPDATNGLSYQRMLHKVSLKHPRKIDGKERRQYPVCGTHTGWYCLCKKWR